MNLTFVPNALEKISPTWVMSDIVKEFELIMDEGYAKLAIKTEHSIFFLESAEPVQDTAEIHELMDQINALSQ